MKTALLEEIFELVKSLSRTEKRYFKLYTGFQQGDKSYLRLFDILDKQEIYDEAVINRKFVSKTRVSNLPAVKKYLFEQIIASIKSYGAYKDLDSDHSDMIESYKVLQYKGLHGQAGRLLKKIKAITLEDEAFIRHFYVLLLEYLREMFNTDDSSVARVHQILAEKKQVFDIIGNYTFVGDPFSYQRLYLRKKLYCRTKKERDELTKLMMPVLKTKETDMLSRTALGLRNLGLCDYYMAIGKPAKAFQISKTYLETRKNAGSAEKIDSGIISEHLQHLWLSLRAGIYDGFGEDIDRFRMLIDPIRNRQKFMMGYERWYNYSFIYYNRTGRFEEATRFIERERKMMENFSNDFSMKGKITLWYFTAYNDYAMNNYKASLKMIQLIVNTTNEEMEEYSFAKLLLMFIHYDLENYELLEYQVRSYQRLMQKTSRSYRCEQLLLDFFKDLSGADSKKQRREQLETLKKEVETAFKTYYESSISFYFDIQSWIGSRLTGQDFAKLVKQAPGRLPDS